MLPNLNKQGVSGRLLVVDDNEDNREVLSRRLKRRGYEVSVAENGARALEMITASPFDLVLLDIMMPELNGYQVLEHIKADEQLRHIPVIMISALGEMESVVRCIEMGADDYLHKPFDPILLNARISACLEKKRLRDQEVFFLQELQKSQKRLAKELTEAAQYVCSLLPPPLTGEVITEWCFIPSTHLGGDSFGYHWLDQDHFAIYLLDVCGHGVGAALLSISVMNVLRAQSLPNTDFHSAADVLRSLNETFPMQTQNNKFFTIWYGVYNKVTRQLCYASGGHPPAVIISGPAKKAIRLKTEGMIIGCVRNVSYKSEFLQLEPATRLYVFSDGVYEVGKPDGTVSDLDEFMSILDLPAVRENSSVDAILRHVREINNVQTFDDDVSLLLVIFP